MSSGSVASGGLREPIHASFLAYCGCQKSLIFPCFIDASFHSLSLSSHGLLQRMCGLKFPSPFSCNVNLIIFGRLLFPNKFTCTGTGGLQLEHTFFERDTIQCTLIIGVHSYISFFKISVCLASHYAVSLLHFFS